MYKTIFLDWNGTISSSKFWGHLEKSNKKEDKLKFKKIEDSLFGNHRDMLKPWMTGEIKSEDIISVIAKDTKINFKTLYNDFMYSCIKMEFCSNDLLKLVSNFRKNGVKVVIATDNMDSFSRWTYPSLGLYNYFDGFLNSHDIKAMKGHSDEKGRSLFFREYLESAGLKPGESALIDDSEDKDNIISSFGVNYIKIEPNVGLKPALLKLFTKYY